jgi:hypothetical protein
MRSRLFLGLKVTVMIVCVICQWLLRDCRGWQLVRVRGSFTRMGWHSPHVHLPFLASIETGAQDRPKPLLPTVCIETDGKIVTPRFLRRRKYKVVSDRVLETIDKANLLWEVLMI